MGKKSGSGIRIRDEQPGSYFRELRNNTYSLMRIRDPRWKNSDSGVGWVPDPQHRSGGHFKPLHFVAAEVESCIEGMKSKDNMVS
jgi:hypothetical protein